MRYKSSLVLMLLAVIGIVLAGCGAVGGTVGDGGEVGTVTRVIDGDTIEVTINGTVYDVRYIGVNTPEDDEPCYTEATEANRNLVGGETVRLEKDESNTDRFDRLLRYVYIDGTSTMVNRDLVELGYAEAVLYPPDDEYYNEFRQLEIRAEVRDLGCHPTGIFDDGSARR